MRFRIDLSYKGSHYAGWQKQPGDTTIQQTLEEALSTLLRENIEVVGCGRTDAGVHAAHYTAHFDFPEISDVDKLAYQLNAILPYDIAIRFIVQVRDDFHARFDAIMRYYEYQVHLHKNPFLEQHSFHFQNRHDIDFDAMNEVASILKNYTGFFPFCKTGSDAGNYQCVLGESDWKFTYDRWNYRISANRFLRGMVRLIVGACLNAGLGKLNVDTIRECMEQQTPLPQPWSVPPEGLYLIGVIYGSGKQGWTAYPPPRRLL